MNKFQQITVILTISSLLVISPCFVINAFSQLPEKNTIQDTRRAAQYFEDELSFTTNPHELKYLIDTKKKNITIIDVRTAKDYAEGHIPGAINIPSNKYNNFEGLEREFPHLRKDGINYVYCYALLCNLSQKAAKKFATLQYPVKEIVGGFQAWKNLNYPIEE